MCLTNVWKKKKGYFDFSLIGIGISAWWISFFCKFNKQWMNLTLSSTVSIKINENSTDLRHFQALNLIIVVRQPIHVMCITDAISFPCSYVFLITELSLESDWALWSHTKKSSTFCSSWKYLNKHFPFCSPQEIPNIFSTFLF